ILHHRRCALLAEFVVVLRATHGIGPTNQLDYIAFRVGDFVPKLVECGFGFLAQDRAVEGKMNRSFGDGMIVIEIRHSIVERIHASGCLVSSLLCLVGRLSGSQRFLVRLRRLLIYALNTAWARASTSRMSFEFLAVR